MDEASDDRQQVFTLAEWGEQMRDLFSRPRWRARARAMGWTRRQIRAWARARAEWRVSGERPVIARWSDVTVLDRAF